MLLMMLMIRVRIAVCPAVWSSSATFPCVTGAMFPGYSGARWPSAWNLSLMLLPFSLSSDIGAARRPGRCPAQPG
ncbi:hypothetical protein PBY51_007161 [Eleginops maclovinus]|uniref:Secreted protein n=1 Tax=Eleginops maclovinus TaxID=56733 RepID=A0AAN7X0X0_ELEMC|nr:hypothetical protein PBY51_007161 [Eleginops maclovinus]